MFGRRPLFPTFGVTALVLVLALTGCVASTSPSGRSSPAAGSDETPSPASIGSPSVGPTPGTSLPEYEPEATEMGQVIATEPLIVRDGPGTGSQAIGTLHQHMSFRFLEGPAPASGYNWYRVRVGELEGWVADGLRSGGAFEPWLAVVDNGPIAVAFAYEEAAAPHIDLVRPSGEMLAPLTDLGDALNAAAIPGRSGGNLLALSCGTEASNLAWSWDGQLLAFNFTSCDGAAFTVDTAGVRSRILDGRTMALSPDARHMVVSENFPFTGCTDPGCEPGPWELHLADLAASTASRITHSSPFVTTSSPDWSPDGRLVAFMADSVGNLSSPAGKLVWTVDVASGTERRLTNGQMPRWSPDGTRLAVLRQASFQVAPTVWIVRADGSDLAALDQGWDVNWSPAGDRISYWRTIATTGQESLVSAPDGSDQLMAPVTGRAVGWSPDGRELLIAGESTLWRWTPGEPKASVIVEGAYVSDAAWQPRLTPISAR